MLFIGELMERLKFEGEEQIQGWIYDQTEL